MKGVARSHQAISATLTQELSQKANGVLLMTADI
jgi:hypothetical protein